MGVPGMIRKSAAIRLRASRIHEHLPGRHPGPLPEDLDGQCDRHQRGEHEQDPADDVRHVCRPDDGPSAVQPCHELSYVAVLIVAAAPHTIISAARASAIVMIHIRVGFLVATPALS